RARHAFQRVRDVLADDLPYLRYRDVLVVAGLRLGRRAEDRRFELCAFGEARSQLLAGEGAVRGIFLPGRTGNIAADHAFDRKYRGALAQHRAAQNVGATVFQIRYLADDLVRIGADHVMRHGTFELPEPPGADLGQHRTLHRNGLRHDHVERA